MLDFSSPRRADDVTSIKGPQGEFFVRKFLDLFTLQTVKVSLETQNTLYAMVNIQSTHQNGFFVQVTLLKLAKH